MVQDMNGDVMARGGDQHDWADWRQGECVLPALVGKSNKIYRNGNIVKLIAICIGISYSSVKLSLARQEKRFFLCSILYLDKNLRPPMFLEFSILSFLFDKFEKSRPLRMFFLRIP